MAKFAKPPVLYPRLSLYFARDVGKAVILRRGPSKWIRMIFWHVDTDKFELGQWFNGKVYDGDLSPNGKVFVYTGGKPYRASIQRDIWTVLSKPPYFTAFALLALAPIYAGEVMFKTNEHILYTHEIHPEPTEDGGELPKQFKLEKFIRDVWMPSVPRAEMLFYRLEQQGWRLKTEIPGDNKKWHDFWQSLTPIIWHKISTGGVLIRQALPSWRFRFEPQQMRYVYQGRETTLENYDAVDLDQRGRLIATRGGQLLHLDSTAPNDKFKVLADFGDQSPEPISPPDWVLKY